MGSADDSRRPRRSQKSKKKTSLMHQTIHSYITFDSSSTACLGFFLTLYSLIMVCILPMLQSLQSTAGPYVPQGPLQGALQGAHIPLPETQKKRLASAAKKLRGQFHQLQQVIGVSDETLLEEAARQFEIDRKEKHNKHAILPMEQKEDSSVGIDTPGVVVLGMHRSGTSMLSGLLVNGIGYNVGGPLIGPAFDNAKGFYERIDVVLQNDLFMRAQGVAWDNRVREYDADLAYKDYKAGKIVFKEGDRALAFLNDASQAPWLHKDPRMCITLKTWLPILKKTPAILFTYRHPMEVALSLKKRESSFNLEHGLRLWLVYNMKAIQNSADLCRVYSSNDAVLADPLKEIQRIADELTSKCNLPVGPQRLTQEDVDVFVDPKMQEAKGELRQEEAKKEILEDYRDGCKVRAYDSDYDEGSFDKQREEILYKKAMEVYCDFQSGAAYEAGYEWPDLS